MADGPSRATDDAGTRGAGRASPVPNAFTHAMRTLGLWLLAHANLTLHLVVAIHPVLGFAWALFPPSALLLTLMAVFELNHFLAFALWTTATCTLASAGLGWWLRRRLRRVVFAGWMLLLPTAMVWLPVLSGELVRSVAMQVAIAHAKPECHDTSSLVASLHRWSEYAPAHAWMIVEGRLYLWSYRELRFIVDERTTVLPARCPRTHRPGRLH